MELIRTSRSAITEHTERYRIHEHRWRRIQDTTPLFIPARVRLERRHRERRISISVVLGHNGTERRLHERRNS